MTYDPTRDPNPIDWLALPEGERMIAIATAHRRLSLGDERRDRMHAVAHLVIENQLALDDPAVTRVAFARLREAGVGRHETIHALSSVMMRFIVDAMQEKPFELSRYEDELSALDPAEWLPRRGPSNRR